MNSNEYMDRLKAIREKYGCSTIPSTSPFNLGREQKPSDSIQYFDKKKIIESSNLGRPSDLYRKTGY